MIFVGPIFIDVVGCWPILPPPQALARWHSSRESLSSPPPALPSGQLAQ